MKLYKGIVLSAFILTGMSFTASAAQEDDGWLKPVGADIETVRAEVKDFEIKEYSYGKKLSAIYELNFEVSGTISECSCILGDTVTKYDILATVSQDSAQAIVDKRAADIYILRTKQSYEKLIYRAETAKLEKTMEEYKARITAGTATNYDRMQSELLELEIDKRDKEYDKILDTQESELDKLNNLYDAANVNLTKNHIFSPCDGKVIFCSIKEGSVVAPFQYVIAICDNNDSYIFCSDLDINSKKDAEKYEGIYLLSGTEKYELEYVADPGKGFCDSGTYFTLPSDIDINDTNSFGIELVKQTQKNVLTIPSCCIYKNGDQRYVYRIGQDGIREMVEILCGDSNSYETVITGGNIMEGDEIYVP